MTAETADFKIFNSAPAGKKATWHHKDPKEWDGAQKLMVGLGVLQQEKDSKPPVHAKTDPVPVYSVWRQHAFILPRILAPLVIHRLYMELTGWTLHPVAAFAFYFFLSFNFYENMFKLSSEWETNTDTTMEHMNEMVFQMCTDGRCSPV